MTQHRNLHSNLPLLPRHLWPDLALSTAEQSVGYRVIRNNKEELGAMMQASTAGNLTSAVAPSCDESKQAEPLDLDLEWEPLPNNCCIIDM